MRIPCQQRYGASECQTAALVAEITRARHEGFAAGVEAAANAVIGYIHPDYGRLPGEAFASAQIRAIKQD